MEGFTSSGASRPFAGQHQPFEGGPALARALREPLDRAAASQSIHEVDTSYQTLG